VATAAAAACSTGHDHVLNRNIGARRWKLHVTVNCVRIG
jgi:hypothetical protein